MDTINRVEAYCRANGYEMTGIGIPKTVDNDLFGTDHTPGYASAARSNALNVMQAGVLARDMKKVDQFVVYQTIGRDAGWLGAATGLAKRKADDAPHLIYCPEFTFSREKFLADVEKVYKNHGWVSVVCGEGLKYEDGLPVSASRTTDKFNNVEFGAMGGASVGLNLHRMISEEFGFRGEFQITESLIMSDMVRATQLDLDEAFQCGLEAVKLAEAGESGYMVSMIRKFRCRSRRIRNTLPFIIRWTALHPHRQLVNPRSVIRIQLPSIKPASSGLQPFSQMAQQAKLKRKPTSLSMTSFNRILRRRSTPAFHAAGAP